MPNVLLAAAAAAVFLPAVPAQAEVGFPIQPSASFNGVAVHRGSANDHGDRRHHRNRHSRDDDFGGFWYYNSDYDQNRSWEPDSYNDWWHDRPDRAFPRWMSDNQDCKRIWWSGGGWRC